PDIILTDLSMPRQDGMELLKGLLEFESKARIIAFSASGDGAVLDVARQLGAHATLDKPFTTQGLYAVVDQAQPATDWSGVTPSGFRLRKAGPPPTSLRIVAIKAWTSMGLMMAASAPI